MAFHFAIFSVLPAMLLTYLPHFIRVAIMTRMGKYDNRKPREQQQEQPEIVTRLAGAHQNQLEALPVYAAGIVANVARQKGGTTLNVLAGCYLGLRALYCLVYAAPQVGGGYVRTAVFAACLAVVNGIWIRAAI